MINKITLKTTVKKICEVLESMEETENQTISLEIFKDMSGDFLDNDDNIITTIGNLPNYIKNSQKKLTINKLKNMSEDEFNKYITDSLVDPEKTKVLYNNIKEALK